MIIISVLTSIITSIITIILFPLLQTRFFNFIPERLTLNRYEPPTLRVNRGTYKILNSLVKNEEMKRELLFFNIKKHLGNNEEFEDYKSTYQCLNGEDESLEKSKQIIVIEIFNNGTTVFNNIKFINKSNKIDLVSNSINSKLYINKDEKVKLVLYGFCLPNYIQLECTNYIYNYSLINDGLVKAAKKNRK